MNIKDSPVDVVLPKHLNGECSSETAGGFHDNDLPFALSAQVLSQSDEIGDLSLDAQAKLLRVLEQKTVQPLGSRGTRTIDFRLVAATNRNLEQMVAHGDFRQDLFYRVDVIHVHIAPLRERRQDIVS